MASFKELIETYGKQIDLRITCGDSVWTSEDIVSCTISFEGALLTSVMKQVDIELEDKADSGMGYPPADARLNIRLTVTANGESAEKDFGTFIVKDVAYNDEYGSVSLTCYDLLLPSMRAYMPFCDFTQPVTLSVFLSQLCQQLGLELATPDFHNAGVPVDEEKYDNQYTYRDVLTEIAQAAGGTIAIKDDTVHVLYPAESGHTVDPSNLKSIEVGERFGPVNSIVIARTPQEDTIYTRADEIEAEGESGSATLEGTLAEELRELIITYAPAHSGSGEPSFDNVLSFATTTGVMADVINADGVTEYTRMQDFEGKAVYGGNFNWKTGVLTETHNLVTFNGSEGWVPLAGETDELLPVGFNGDLLGFARANTALCDRFVRGTGDGTPGQFWVQPAAGTTYNVRFMVPKAVATTVAEWKSYLAGNPMQAVFEMTEPEETALTRTELPSALAGYTRLVTYSDHVYVLATGEFTLTGEIKIENNQIMDSHREDFLEGLRAAMFGLEFYPYDITSFGIGYLDIGDRFTLQTLDGRKYSCLFLSDEIEITQGIVESSKVEAPIISETDYKAADTTDKRLNQTILRVDKQEGVIQGLVTKQVTVDERLTELSTMIEQTAEQVSIAIHQTVDEVTTSTGFTFNADGMHVVKDGKNVSTTVDEDGINVSRNGEDVLIADSTGVDAVDVRVHNYLVIGENSRFEDYTNADGEARTACFFVG